MTQHAMPYLVVNYGCEMMFVLAVRLEAQLIEPTKSRRIKSDVLSSMFSAAFMDELFRPQDMYTNGALRKVFTTISDSSVMKLSDNSMKKLYDLMSMTVKYQVLTLHHPYELLDYTMNHLDALREVCPTSTHASIDGVAQRILRLTSALSAGELAEIRNAILNFLLDRHVKVSLFLERHIQFADGSFKVPRATHLAPLPSASAPGTITAHVANRQVRTERFFHRDAGMTLPPHVPVGSWGPQYALAASARMTTAGANLYRSGLAGGDVLAAQTYGLPGRADSAYHQGMPPVTPLTAQQQHVMSATSEQLQAYHNEMSYLTQLVSGRPPAQERITLSLFDDADDDSADSPVPPSAATISSTSHGAGVQQPQQPQAASADFPDPESSSTMIKFCKMDPGAVRQENRQLLGIISDFEGGGARGGAGVSTGGTTTAAIEKDNLLDIMDDL